MSKNYGKRIKRAANIMPRSMDAYAARYRLTGSQMSIIDFLGESQDRTQRDIEMEFDIRPSTTAKNPATNGGQRTDHRQAGPQGRPSTHHCAPAKARDLQKAVRTYIDNQQKAMERQFDHRDLAAFDRVLAYFTTLNSDDPSQAGKESRS